MNRVEAMDALYKRGWDKEKAEQFCDDCDVENITKLDFDFLVYCRENLSRKREETSKLLKENVLTIDSSIPFRSRRDYGYHTYADLLSIAVALEDALKDRRWESADELADHFTVLSPFKDDKRCVMIINKLLEDADV